MNTSNRLLGTRSPRRGAVTLEIAVMIPLLLVLLLGILVGGMGVFRYQQVASLSREAARHAAVKGATWEMDTGNTSPTRNQIIQDVVRARAVSMEPAKLALTIEWIDGVNGNVVAWDSSSKAPRSITAAGQPVANRLRVTVTYQWLPEWFLAGPITMQSVSEVPMSF
jgi:Flp pilus assembly protein TadG